MWHFIVKNTIYRLTHLGLSPIMRLNCWHSESLVFAVPGSCFILEDIHEAHVTYR